MSPFFRTALLFIAFCFSNVACAGNPAYIGRYERSPQDMKALLKLTEDFRSALREKNVSRLSELVLDSTILFASPGIPYDGAASRGYERFARYVGASSTALEQKFYNIQITQDGHIGWVTFDFEFLQDAKVVNYGVETWQVLKTADGQWKILTAIWSSHGIPH
jgi:ketosteroid isomerase-like protein